MKLYLKYKNDGGVTIIETDWVNLENNEINYFNDNREYNEELSNLDIVKLDGEVMYRDEEIALDFKGAIKSVLTIQDFINEGIEEYLKEKENVK